MKEFGGIAKPQTNMLRKYANLDEFKAPAVEQKQYFSRLKEGRVSPTVFGFTKFGRDYMLDLGAAGFQLGCYQLKEQENGEYLSVGY